MVANCTVMNCNYNLSLLTNTDIVSNPVNYVANVNQLAGSYIILGGMILLGLVLFVTMKNNANKTDSESLLYSGFVMSIIGTLLFVATEFGITSAKLLTWPQLLPFIVITMAAIIWNKWNG